MELAQRLEETTPISRSAMSINPSSQVGYRLPAFRAAKPTRFIDTSSPKRMKAKLIRRSSMHHFGRSELKTVDAVAAQQIQQRDKQEMHLDAPVEVQGDHTVQKPKD